MRRPHFYDFFLKKIIKMRPAQNIFLSSILQTRKRLPPPNTTTPPVLRAINNFNTKGVGILFFEKFIFKKWVLHGILWHVCSAQQEPQRVCQYPDRKQNAWSLSGDQDGWVVQ
jgi:hypothetical protein